MVTTGLITGVVVIIVIAWFVLVNIDAFIPHIKKLQELRKKPEEPKKEVVEVAA